MAVVPAHSRILSWAIPAARKLGFLPPLNDFAGGKCKGVCVRSRSGIAGMKQVNCARFNKDPAFTP